MDGRHDGAALRHSLAPAEKAALLQSRETGDLVADPLPSGRVKALPFAKSWVHFVAGG